MAPLESLSMCFA